MKVFVTGAAGQLGRDLTAEISGRSWECVGADLAGEGCLPLDITDPQAVNDAIVAARPDAVIHCAAWTAVDAAEVPENRARVYAVNALGTEHVARACAAVGCRLFYISTDYVFDGRGERPWRPDDPRAPLNWYGAAKAAGEEAVERIAPDWAIVRIAWVFGPQGKNFVRTMLDLGRTRGRVSVVNDQIGTPTYTPDLARLLADMAGTGARGRFHVTNEGGYISWYEFAAEIFRQAARIDPVYARVQVEAISSVEYPAKAARPSNSRLDRSRIAREGFAPLPDWRDALGRYLRLLLA